MDPQLYEAVVTNNVSAVNLLIRAGVDINLSDTNGNTALFYAISGKYTAIVRVLLEAGGGVSHRNNERRTPLVCAILAMPAEPAIVALLLRHGAPLEDRWEDKTPLMLAAAMSEGEVVQMLLNAGADIHATGERSVYAGALERRYHPRVMSVLVDYLLEEWPPTTRSTG